MLRSSHPAASPASGSSAAAASSYTYAYPAAAAAAAATPTQHIQPVTTQTIRILEEMKAALTCKLWYGGRHNREFSLRLKWVATNLAPHTHMISCNVCLYLSLLCPSVLIPVLVCYTMLIVFPVSTIFVSRVSNLPWSVSVGAAQHVGTNSGRRTSYSIHRSIQ